MTRGNAMQRLSMIASSLAFAGALAGSASAADVHVGVHIGVPAPPPIVFEAPPRLVVVPSAPRVYYAPDATVNFFSYGGRYYTNDDGYWFVARDYGGPWSYVERRHVPHDILVVPHRYYHVPPRLVGGGHWDHGNDHGHGHYKQGKWKQKGGHYNGGGHGKHGHGKHH
jgi:hypothetical protein